MLKFLKELNEKHKAWIRGNGYVFNKPLFLLFFSVALLLLIVVAVVDGYETKFSVSCPEDSTGGCFNPLSELEDCNHACCQYSFIPAGSVCGERVSWLGRNYSWLIIGGFVLLLLFNHFLFNRGYDFDKYWGDFK